MNNGEQDMSLKAKPYQMNSLPAADWETKTCGVCCCCCCGNREGTQPSWEKLLLDIPELCSCCGFTLQILGGSDADVVLVLKDDVV